MGMVDATPRAALIAHGRQCLHDAEIQIKERTKNIMGAEESQCVTAGKSSRIFWLIWVTARLKSRSIGSTAKVIMSQVIADGRPAVSRDGTKGERRFELQFER
jgi:hypothetical protein